MAAMSLIERRPKVAQVAALAGVSTATVDRVINGRGGVRRETVTRVETAIRSILSTTDNGPIVDPLRPSNIVALLAGDGSHVTNALGEHLARMAESAGARMTVSFVERMNPEALAQRLADCLDEGCTGVAVQALDHVLVREALQRLAHCRIPVVTLLTDTSGVERLAYAGLDNRAAGRTAGILMSRFCRGSGKLAIVWGGQLYRSHEERESGFRNAVRSERTDLQCLDVITGNDDTVVARDLVREALRQHADLAGIYCVGGGITGVADAIEEIASGRKPVMIGHNYNQQTKPYLLAGTIDALIHQDPERIARRALDSLLSGRPPATDGGIPIDIVTRENTMHR
jgi:LacI family transcriptional regulator